MKQIILFLFIGSVFKVSAQVFTPTPLSLYLNQVDPTVTFFNQYFVPPPTTGPGVLGYDDTDQYYSNLVLGNGFVYDHTSHTFNIDFTGITPSIVGLGTAAMQNTTSFATAAQGSKADSALQSASIESSVQAYSSVLDTFTTNGSAYYLSRSNATGTQTASTISDFSTAAISAVTWSTLTGKPSFATVATNGSYNDLSNKPMLPVIQAYEGTTQRVNAFPVFKDVTVSSGVAVFYLTTDNTSTGMALFSNGVIADSVNVTVGDATASYQMSWTFTNSNKTLTVTANKLTTSNILTGILGQTSANSAVIKLQIWGY